MKARLLCAGWLLVAPLAPARAQVAFNLSYDSGIDVNALAGFQEAAARWSALFSDPITINLHIGFDGTPGNGILGVTNSPLYNVGYSTFSTALTADRTSTNDDLAVGSLQGGSSYGVLLNHPSTADSTYLGSGDTLAITLANARALGLYQASGGLTDASITFNSSFTFDFDPSNGITAGAYDFVGVATHEIGHALGFYSGADFLDQNPSLAEADTVQTPLDLFRYSTLSIADGVFDVSADARTKYFSIDGGATDLGTFSTGVTFGDGRQASHWQENLGIGIMDPTAAPGEFLSISALDLTAFDVIGYDLAAVPEPANLGGLMAALAGLYALRRRRKKVARATRAGFTVD
ncbi:MAG TPA: NF038122 family metalloprotease [Opitutus sp.]|nr:NF038122 family metalloprotease [Opitutus sp.]